MTSQTNLAPRANRARAAAQFIGQIGNGKNTTYRVPGSNGKSYRVKIRRNGILSAQCWLDETQAPCPGCGAGTVCYHGLATCEYIANKKGLKIAWCASYESAVKLSSLGGKVFRVKSHEGHGTVYGVISPTSQAVH